MSDAVEKAADELYALAPADFTSSRNEIEKGLRKEGDREAAAAVKALRKPTVPAWALNQVARGSAKEVKRLVAAGAKLRDAQEKLLGGGKRDALDKATRALRELSSELSRTAVGVASHADQATGAAFQEAVKSTLHAAALDEEVAAELEAGRLVKEREVVSLPGLGAGGDELAPARPAPKRGKVAKKVGARKEAAGKGRTAAKKSSEESKPSAAEERRRTREIEAAQEAEARAGRAAEAALRALEEERKRVERATTRLAEAERDAAEAGARLDEARTEVKRLAG